MTRVRDTSSGSIEEQLPHLIPRAPRNHVRIALSVESGGHAFSAETVNASTTGIAIHIHAHGVSPQPGDILVVRTTAAEPVRCRVVWVERPEHNSYDEEVVAVGACFMEPQRAAAFLAAADATRHALLLLCGDDALGDHIEHVLNGYCRVLRPRTCANAMSALLTDNISVLLCDDSMPHPGPAEFLTTVHDCFPRAPWVSIASAANLQAAELSQLINAAQVYRYVHKPIDDTQLVTDVRSALRRFDDARVSDTLRRELEHANQKLERENAALKKSRAD